MKLGIVIVTYNNEHTILECLRSIATEEVNSIHIIDSHSTDQTIQILQRQGCAYTVLDANKGFSHAANIGATFLDTDYILFLNPDTELLPGALHAMKSAIETSPHAAVVGGMLVDATGLSENDAFGGEIGLLHMIFRHVQKKTSLRNISSVAWVSGGALMIKRSIFEQLGGFDEEFFLYWEDIDLCKRVRDAGYGVYINPKAKVFHHRGVSSQGQQRKTELYDASANRYFQKYHSPLICYLQILLRNIYRLLRPLAH